MAEVQIVLRYGDHEASRGIPLSLDIPEGLRRVSRKKGTNPKGELAFQLAQELRQKVDGIALFRELAAELVEKEATSVVLGDSVSA